MPTSVSANINKRLLPVLLLFVLLLQSAMAMAIELQGELTQGGLVQGQVAADARVTLDGESVRVTDDGRFLLGFDRDADDSAVLKIIHADGSHEQQILVIRQRDYNIQRIDGLPEKQVSPSKQALARIEREAQQMEAARADTLDTATLYTNIDFDWPLRGRISGVYGSQRILNGKPKRPHYGLDIAAAAGTPIKAPAAGVVAFIHPDMYFNGTTVLLDHGLGLRSTYIHLSRVDVKTGDWVDRGQIIGAVGQSGRATGPHLHWGVDWFDRHIDPRLLTGPMPD